MAPPVGDGGEEEKAPFRWLDAARYAAASVVTVLIITVIVKAARVVIVPDSLYVSVVQGSIFVRRDVQVPPTLLFDLNLRIDNPRRHARMYYTNVTAYLFDNDTPPSTLHPGPDSFVYFPQADQAVKQLEEVNYGLQLSATREVMTEFFFDLLYNNDSARMNGVTMRLDTRLITEGIATKFNSTSSRRVVRYYCWPLVVLRYEDLLNSGEDLLGDDVFCREARGSRFI
ncbi:unnamed protein product [Urochloa decumbens]|uniref:Late embryogenesis abundant protein LEA-2 subgroup domain-containing protein n=1 Tax=Urochloa decumbens TaxID=240449 RepID=A0ABC9DTV9_9POAL